MDKRDSIALELQAHEGQDMLVKGHDCVIMPIKSDDEDARLSPDPANLAAMLAILKDRKRPYFKYRLAA